MSSPNIKDHYDRKAIGSIAEKTINKISQEILIDGHPMKIGAALALLSTRIMALMFLI
jgi:hypothetical protein